MILSQNFLLFFFPPGRKKVETLLQQMFEGEIDPEDDGQHFDEDEIDVRPRKLTLDTVS